MPEYVPAPEKYVPVRTTITNSCYDARYIKDQSGEKALAYSEQREKRANFTILIFFFHIWHMPLKKGRRTLKRLITCKFVCNSNID